MYQSKCGISKRGILKRFWILLLFFLSFKKEEKVIWNEKECFLRGYFLNNILCKLEDSEFSSQNTVLVHFVVLLAWLSSFLCFNPRKF